LSGTTKKTSITLVQLNLTRLHLLEDSLQIENHLAKSFRTRDREKYRSRAISAYYRALLLDLHLAFQYGDQCCIRDHYGMSPPFRWIKPANTDSNQGTIVVELYNEHAPKVPLSFPPSPNPTNAAYRPARTSRPWPQEATTIPFSSTA
jgi:hypothetical protein